MRVRLLYLIKGKKANEGEIRKWKSGYMMKVGTKWIRVEQKNGKWVKVDEPKKPKAKPKDGVKGKTDAVPKKKAKTEAAPKKKAKADGEAKPKKKAKTEAVPKKKAKAVKVKKEVPSIKEEPGRLSVRDYLGSKKQDHLQAEKEEKTLNELHHYVLSKNEEAVTMTASAFIEMHVYDREEVRLREHLSEDIDKDRRTRDIHALNGRKEGPLKDALRKKLNDINNYRKVIGYDIQSNRDKKRESWSISKAEYEYGLFLLDNKDKEAAKTRRKYTFSYKDEADYNREQKMKAEEAAAADDPKNPYSKYNRLAETVIESISNNDLSTVKRAIKEHPDIVDWYHSRTRKTLLHNALNTESPDMDIVKELIRAGSDVNAADRSGDSALHYAAYNGSAVAAKALIDAGAGESINARGSEGTPLDYAVAGVNSKGESKMVDILIAGGASVEANRDYDENVLHRIKSQAVGELLIRNASVEALNQRDSRGRTPLEVTIGNGKPWSLPLVKEFIHAGANISGNKKGSGENTIISTAYTRWRANAEEGLPIIEELVRAGISKQEFIDHAEKRLIYGKPSTIDDNADFYVAMDRI